MEDDRDEVNDTRSNEADNKDETTYQWHNKHG